MSFFDPSDWAIGPEEGAAEPDADAPAGSLDAAQAAQAARPARTSVPASPLPVPPPAQGDEASTLPIVPLPAIPLHASPLPVIPLPALLLTLTPTYPNHPYPVCHLYHFTTTQGCATLVHGREVVREVRAASPPSSRRDSLGTSSKSVVPAVPASEAYMAGGESLRELRQIVAKHEMTLEVQHRAIAELEATVSQLLIGREANGDLLISPPFGASRLG
jgi:hypothetical protein